MRRQFIPFLVMVCWPGLIWAQAQPGSQSEFIEFDGAKLYFAYEDEVPGTKFREYILQNESLKTWTRMARVDHYSNVNDPNVLARTLHQVTQSLNPGAPFEARYNKDKQIAIVDYITWPPDFSYMEYNVVRIEKNGRGSLISYTYSVREHKDLQNYAANIKPIRKRLVREMIEKGITFQRGEDRKQVASRPKD